MRINGTNLSMVRGDSEAFRVSCSTPFTSGDVVTMTVRRDVRSPIEIQKIVTEFDENGKATFGIDPEDTADLEFTDHVYDVQVVWGATGMVKTIVEKSYFTLREEVTY